MDPHQTLKEKNEHKDEISNLRTISNNILSNKEATVSYSKVYTQMTSTFWLDANALRRHGPIGYNVCTLVAYTQRHVLKGRDILCLVPLAYRQLGSFSWLHVV